MKMNKKVKDKKAAPKKRKTTFSDDLRSAFGVSNTQKIDRVNTNIKTRKSRSK